MRAVSEPPGGGSYAERKARLRDAVGRASADAAAVYAADKVTKVRELRLNLVRHGGFIDKREHYWASLELLEHRLGHHPLVRRAALRTRGADADAARGLKRFWTNP